MSLCYAWVFGLRDHASRNATKCVRSRPSIINIPYCMHSERDAQHIRVLGIRDTVIAMAKASVLLGSKPSDKGVECDFPRIDIGGCEKPVDSLSR